MKFEHVFKLSNGRVPNIPIAQRHMNGIEYRFLNGDAHHTGPSGHFEYKINT